jgi:hypothetical protein
MSSIPSLPSSEKSLIAVAANADRLSDTVARAKTLEVAIGWDSYEVWRRFIKDVRDRRERTPS